MNAEWNNFIMSNTAANFGKYVEAINNRYVAIQNNVKNLRAITNSVY